MDGTPGTVVKVDMGGGRIVAVEARNVSPEHPVGISDILKFDGVAESIEAVADRVIKALENVKPQRATVEFGVDVGVASGALTGLIATGTGSASLKVTLEWEPRTPGGTDG
ncbi:MAG: hypothetical protein M3O70_04685 [Actinomycetota bacterium]|nr:hypothetical protein [Actinomycetota bacterium]